MRSITIKEPTGSRRKSYTYKVKVITSTGTIKEGLISAYTKKQALIQAKKKFPSAKHIEAVVEKKKLRNASRGMMQWLITPFPVKLRNVFKAYVEQEGLMMYKEAEIAIFEYLEKRGFIKRAEDDNE